MRARTTHLPKCWIIIPRWQYDSMWVIDNFEESCFYITPLISFSLLVSSTTSPCGVCFLTFITDGVSLISWQALRYHKQVESQWLLFRHPLEMARSPDDLLMWQTSDIHGGTSGVLVRDLFRPSVAWNQGMSFFMRFCSRWKRYESSVSQIECDRAWQDQPAPLHWYHFGQ